MIKIQDGETIEEQEKVAK